MSKNDILLGELYIRLMAVENILIRKGVLTEQELFEEVEKVSIKLIDMMSQQYPEFADLAKVNKATSNNALFTPPAAVTKKGDPTKN